MRKATVSILIATILLLVLGVAPAAATTPLDIVINGTLDFTQVPASGPFTASGPAVEAGLFCSEGTVIGLGSLVTGWQSYHGAKFGIMYHSENMLVCKDGSGTITLQINARLDWRTNWEAAVAVWVVKEGTGKYASLHGTGDIYGVEYPDSVDDHYTGQLN